MIRVVDSLLPKDRIEWAINYMNSSDKRFIYLTTLLDECERIQSMCPAKDFRQPEYAPYKQTSFIELVSEGHNIVTTHAILKRLKWAEQESSDVRRWQYELIVDGEIETLLPTWGLRLDEIKDIADSRNLFKLGYGLFRRLPLDFLNLFENVYVMTYNFQFSHMYKDMTLAGTPYEICHIEDSSLKTGLQDISSHKQWFKDNVKIYQGRTNKIGEGLHDLSAAQMKKMTDQERIKFVGKIRSYFIMVGAPANRCMYIRNKSPEELERSKILLPVHSFSKAAFVPYTLRGSQEFKNRDVLCYAVNEYEAPGFVSFYNKRGLKTSQNDVALTAMLQWIYMSAVGQQEDRTEPIHLAVFSSRMRKLLTDWLDS